MKVLALILLSVIAAGVAYLALAKYKEYRAIEHFNEAMADPDSFYAKQWADQAQMECERFEDVELAPLKTGGQRPIRFTCVTSSYEKWRVRERECSDEEQDRSRTERPSGEPMSEDQVFQPLTVLCCLVTATSALAIPTTNCAYKLKKKKGRRNNGELHLLLQTRWSFEESTQRMHAAS